MANEIPQHRHCQMCGKAIPVDQVFCSEECKNKYEQLMKKRRRMFIIMYALLIAIFIIIFAIPYI